MRVRLRHKACFFIVIRKRVLLVKKNLEANLDSSQGWEYKLSGTIVTEGHFKWDCPKLKGKEDGKKTSNEKSSANIVKDIFSANDVLSVAVHDASRRDEWTLDSGCSYHMCLNKDCFVTYQLIDGADILLENDMSCKTIRISSIKIRMHYGVFWTLCSTYTKLKKNLISLGKLDDNGYNFSNEDQVLRVSKGSLVFMKRKKLNTLYIL